MVRSRESWRVDGSLPRTDVDWKGLLRDGEQCFLTDNQLSVFLDSKAPGCRKVHFFPLPFAHGFREGRWDFAEIMSGDSLVTTGPSLDLPVGETALEFLPCLLVKRMRAGGRDLEERSAVHGNVFSCVWDLRGVGETVLSFGLPRLEAEADPADRGLVLSVRDAVFAAVVLRGAEVSVESADPRLCRLRVRPAGGGRVSLGLACGYDRAEAREAARTAAEDPRAVQAAAERTWDEWFTRAVPGFSCSDARLTRLYYYQAYATRANLYDIPYEPYTHPYTCPWKTGAVWQWTWNTPMGSLAERWLNDKSVGAGGNLQILANGGALHIGAHLRPLRRIGALRDYDAYARYLGRCLERLPADFDMDVLTTLPFTAPNGLLGAYEHALCVGDPAHLGKVLRLLLEAEEGFSRGALPNGLCACRFVDEFDYSLRLRPFLRDFRKADPEMMLRMDTPFLAPDFNCGLYALRERILEAARSLGDASVDAAGLERRNRGLKDAINSCLWDEGSGFYYDADPRTMERSPVKCVAGFSALYSGVADAARAARLVAHLDDPREFAAPYPLPSVSLDTPDVDPTLLTYGGDSLITSEIWFTVEGLARHGYRDRAARMLLKALEMVGRDGPSSAYSYDVRTGRYNQDKHTLAAQSLILTDLVCRYLVGIVPGPHGTFRVDPLALEASGLERLSFGPYRYCGKDLRVEYGRGEGYRLTVG